MLRFLRKKVNLAFIVNPFYLFSIAFSFAIFVYLWGWSEIFPKLTAGLIIFFAFSFVIFIYAGNLIGKKEFLILNRDNFYPYLNDIIFWSIIFLGFINVLSMGYLPVLDQSHDYRAFGVPVVDTLFNTLSIFFSVFFFQSYLEMKKKRFLIYFFIILIFQILIFRRSTIVWILASSSFLLLLYKRKINFFIIIAGTISILLFSYCFGLYGNVRSKLTKSIVLNNLGASDAFKNSGINYNHYMTYLYVSSPLANLQENVKNGEGFLNNKDIKGFLYYCLIPESLTNRLEKSLELSKPVCSLISPDLIVGSFFMVSFYTMGWPGMIAMVLFLFAFIMVCLFIIGKWKTFNITTFSLLSTTVSLLIFSNFLNRFDVILMLFIYPILFHLIYTRSRIVLRFSFPSAKR